MRLLTTLLVFMLTPVLFAAEESIAFPKSSHVVDVTKAPYNAKGDGKTDDTAAIQKALDDTMGLHKIVYFPNGTYLVSDTLRFTNKNSAGKNAYGFNWLQGQSTDKTILKLKDKTFTDTTKAKPIIWGGGFGSADWFHNYVQNVTFDTGSGNPGGIGIQFYSNNTGAIRDVLIKSGDGAGFIGLDLGFKDMNGPLLAKNIEVRGFETGVRTAASVNSQTLEHIKVSGSTKVGLVNFGQHLSVRKFQYDGPATAIKTEGFLALLDSEFTGTGKAKDLPAIDLGKAPFLAKNVTATGYAKSLSTGEQKLKEYISGKPANPFDVPVTTLGLPVEEPPEFGWDDPKTWAVAEAYGADPTGSKDSSAAIQKAIDSGKKTVFLPGFYQISKPIIVRGKVERIIGSGGWIDYLGKTTPNFIIGDGDAKQVVIEHFANINGGIEVNTERSVLLRSMDPKAIKFKKASKVFIEDVVTNDVKLIPKMKLWARQFNIENEGTHLTNDGGNLWVLGYKTERGGTLLHTKNKGRSELYGTMSYTTTAGKLAPMFITEDAEAFAFFGEVCYTGDPFAVWCKDKQGSSEKTLKAGAGGLAPYISRPPAK
jgi:Pectate lyase superfamily protein